MKKARALVVALLLTGLFLCWEASCRTDVANPVDLEALRGAGDDWELVRQSVQPDSTHLRFHHNKWLMFFLHWRPLTEEKKNISVDYARRQMLSFWGPNMPFTITSVGGETEVSGHRAVFIDGTISQGMVRTRFIIWNCAETNRQFIADCNINVSVGTPEELLELEVEITKTISCHGQTVRTTNPVLKRFHVSEEFNLSFFIPENWRTHVFNSDKWFPQGPTGTNGTLWTLMTDSEKSIDLFWTKRPVRRDEDVFRKFLEQLGRVSYEWKDTHYEVRGLESRNITALKGYLVGEGEYALHQSVKAKDQERTGQDAFIYKAFLWTKGKRAYFLVVSLISRQALWGRPVDLSPTPETFERYVREEVLPRILVFDRKYPADVG